jgi:hypothetical protein
LWYWEQFVEFHRHWPGWICTWHDLGFPIDLEAAFAAGGRDLGHSDVEGAEVVWVAAPLD